MVEAGTFFQLGRSVKYAAFIHRGAQQSFGIRMAGRKTSGTWFSMTLNETAE